MIARTFADAFSRFGGEGSNTLHIYDDGYVISIACSADRHLAIRKILLEEWQTIDEARSSDGFLSVFVIRGISSGPHHPIMVATRLPPDWNEGYPNVWLGVTCGIASSLNRLDLLKKIPAALRWVSAEPLLGPIDFRPYLDGSFKWIITGCEQAGVSKRRELDLNWVRDIDQQCRNAGVAHFFKQRYDTGHITHDGLLDGEVRQAWPG